MNSTDSVYNVGYAAVYLYMCVASVRWVAMDCINYQLN